jgi:hypothetical protein
VVLEGDFCAANDFKYVPVKQMYTTGSDELKNTFAVNTDWVYKRNHSVLNFDTLNSTVDLNEVPFNPISRLQLLALNTGESYPFADRLIEYLSGSAITPIDDIADNILRVQRVMSENNHYFKIDGLWENKMQKIAYDYIINSGPIELDRNKNKPTLKDCRSGYYRGLGHTTKSMLFDITGYIDRDVENWYSSWTKDTKDNGYAPKIKNSIKNIDIYDGLFDT